MINYRNVTLFHNTKITSLVCRTGFVPNHMSKHCLMIRLRPSTRVQIPGASEQTRAHALFCFFLLLLLNTTRRSLRCSWERLVNNKQSAENALSNLSLFRVNYQASLGCFLRVEIMSTGCDASSSCPIPSRASHPHCWSSLPDSYCQTPGGTVFSTTPGGKQPS